LKTAPGTTDASRAFNVPEFNQCAPSFTNRIIGPALLINDNAMMSGSFMEKRFAFPMFYRQKNGSLPMKAGFRREKT